MLPLSCRHTVATTKGKSVAGLPTTELVDDD